MGVPAQSEVREALRSCRAHFGYAIVFNGLTNILMLAYPIFSLQLFDRVVGARSVETLITLCVGLTVALVFRAVFLWVRGAVFVRAAVRLDRRLTNRVLAALLERSA